jgi:hypothetical protein
MIEGNISSRSLESEISGESSLEGKVSGDNAIEGEVSGEHSVEGEVSGGHSVEGELSGERSIMGRLAGKQRMTAAVAPKALDGVSPEVEITEVEGGHKIIITDVNGAKEAVVKDGRGIELFWQSKVTTTPGDTNEWTIRYTDGTESVIAIKNSEDGKPGAPGYTPIKGVDYDDGAPGFSPVVSLRKEGEVTLLAITDIKGTQEVRINDGEPGTPGSAGVGIANVTQIVKSGTDGGTNVVTIALTDGTEHSFEVQNGTKGRAITVIDVDESLADDEHNRVLFSDGSVLKVKNGRTGSPGKNGKSITITDIYESNANGGKNIVLFSDGTTLHIKNGEIGLRDRPDWSENDTSALAYIRNRTHWIEQALEVITEDMGIGSSEIIESFNTGFESPLVLKIVVGNKYAINTDPSVYYYCTAYDYTDSNGDTFIALGDSRLDGVASETHPEDVPVFIKYSVKEETPSDGGVRYRHQFRYFYSDSTANNAKLSALGSDVVYHPLDEKFIPDTIARVSQLGEAGTTITGFVESTEPGGSSIVTFSDGSSLAIKNGADGSPGKDGRGITGFVQTGYSPSPGGENEYTIYYSDETTSTMKIKNGENGADGSSVYISSIKESDEDGGENVITFGGVVPKTLTVKNGSKGATGTFDSSALNDYAKKTDLNKKADDFSIEIYNGTGGNPKPVRFASFNYSTCNSENGIAAKISLVSGHGNGSSYAFLEDAIIKVSYQGSVSVDNFKYYGADTGTYDGASRQYGDIFWLVDTTNKIVDFYCLMGQYARVYQTPWKRLTYSTGGTVTQYTSCTVYSSGTKTWANNAEIATLSDIPASLPPTAHTHGYIQDGTVGVKASDSNEVSFASNANYLYFGYDNRLGSSGVVDTYKFGTHSGAANAAKGTIECGKVVEDGTSLTDKYAPKSHSHNYLLTSGGTLSGSLDFRNSSSWITPYLLAFKNADTGASPTYPYTGFYQWGNEWQVNARDANNAWAKNVMSINLVSGVATFGATPTVNGVSMHHDGNNARGTLVSSETNPTTNGHIAWQYE